MPVNNGGLIGAEPQLWKDLRHVLPAMEFELTGLAPDEYAAFPSVAQAEKKKEKPIPQRSAKDKKARAERRQQEIERYRPASTLY